MTKPYETKKSLCITHSIPAENIPFLFEVQKKYQIKLPHLILAYSFLPHPHGSDVIVIDGRMYFATYSTCFGLSRHITQGNVYVEELQYEEFADEIVADFTEGLVLPNAEEQIKPLLKMYMAEVYGLNDEI